MVQAIFHVRKRSKPLEIQNCGGECLRDARTDRTWPQRATQKNAEAIKHYITGLVISPPKGCFVTGITTIPAGYKRRVIYRWMLLSYRCLIILYTCSRTHALPRTPQRRRVNRPPPARGKFTLFAISVDILRNRQIAYFVFITRRCCNRAEEIIHHL